MNEILSSQVHEHIFGGDENNNLNGPRRLLAENLDYQQMELTTEDREDHTFNGKRSCCLFFTSRRETQIGWWRRRDDEPLKDEYSYALKPFTSYSLSRILTLLMILLK